MRHTYFLDLWFPLSSLDILRLHHRIIATSVLLECPWATSLHHGASSSGRRTHTQSRGSVLRRAPGCLAGRLRGRPSRAIGSLSEAPCAPHSRRRPESSRRHPRTPWARGAAPPAPRVLRERRGQILPPRARRPAGSPGPRPSEPAGLDKVAAVRPWTTAAPRAGAAAPRAGAAAVLAGRRSAAQARTPGRAPPAPGSAGRTEGPDPRRGGRHTSSSWTQSATPSKSPESLLFS